MLQLLNVYPVLALGVTVVTVLVFVPVVTPFISKLFPLVSTVAPLITFALVGLTVPLFVSLLANVIVLNVAVADSEFESV